MQKENYNARLTKKQQDSLQVNAFRAIHKSLLTEEKITNEIAFAGAIELTSDEKFEKLQGNTELEPQIQQWLKMNQKRRNAHKRLNHAESKRIDG